MQPQDTPPSPTCPPACDFHLHDAQSEIFSCKARFRILVAGRRFGKTHLALVEMIMLAMKKPASICWYVGPTDHQSKRIAWQRLKALSEPFWAGKPREAECRINLRNGSTLVVYGAFKPDRLRGDGIDFVVLDEFAGHHPNAWTEVLRPALADRQGRALFIGTPKGHDHFFDLTESVRSDPDWVTFHRTTIEGGIVTAAEINSAARQLDPQTFRQEFEAEFIAIGRHLAYHTFDRAVNVRPVEFNPLHPLIWSLDFNVNPMCMLLMQRIGDVVNVIDEIVIKENASTEAACQVFHDRVAPLARRVPHTHAPLEVQLYGDASGNQHRTSAASTDWILIKHSFAQHRGVYRPKFLTPTANPAVRDRLNCVNSRLRNQLGESHLFVHPNCRELIRDFEQVTWAVDANGSPATELSKSDPKRTHASDALGYFISQAFPLRNLIGPQSTGRII